LAADVRIRMATTQDCEDVRAVYLCAFPENERVIVSALAVSLLSESTNPPTISLIAESDGLVAGHVAFSPVSIDGDEDLQGYILAPLGVRSAFQKRRIGSQLVDYGLQKLKKAGVNIVFVYGDPRYYGRLGFRSDTAGRYTPPYELQYPLGWQARALTEFYSERESVQLSCVASLCDPELW